MCHVLHVSLQICLHMINSDYDASAKCVCICIFFYCRIFIFPNQYFILFFKLHLFDQGWTYTLENTVIIHTLICLCIDLLIPSLVFCFDCLKFQYLIKDFKKNNYNVWRLLFWSNAFKNCWVLIKDPDQICKDRLFADLIFSSKPVEENETEPAL